MGLWTSLAATVFLSLSLSIRGDTLHALPQSEKARLRVDLRAFGLKETGRWGPTTAAFGSPFWSYDSVAFSGSRVIIATFLTPQSQAPNPPPYVNAVLVDSSTGQVLGSSRWAVPHREVGLVPTQGGRFVVRTRERMTLYSPTLEPLGEFALPDTHRPKSEYWEVRITPSRRFLVVEHTVGETLEVLWVDPDTLQVRNRWRAPEGKFRWSARAGEHNVLRVSDTHIAAVLQRVDSPDYVVAVGPIGGRWQEIFRAEVPDITLGGGVQFIDDRTLLNTDGQELTLLSTAGQVLHTERFKKKEFARYGRPSANGRRFAVPICTWKGGWLPDTSAHLVVKRIMVYDLPSRRWIYTLDSKRVDLKRLSAFALSEDGSLLAVLRDRAVEVYRLPGPVPQSAQ